MWPPGHDLRRHDRAEVAQPEKAGPGFELVFLDRQEHWIMASKRYLLETIIRELGEAEVLQGPGRTIAQFVGQLGITEQTSYRWCK